MPSPKTTRLFHRALEMSAADRAGFLRKAAPDEATRREVEELLQAHHDASSNFLGKAPLLRAVPSQPRLTEGETVGDFEIRREIGAGSFGTVYVAYDRTLGREVAIKVTRNEGEEGRMMGPLDHDNIVKVHSESVLRDRDLRILCMPYVTGSCLQKILTTRGKLPLDGKAYLETIAATANGSATFDPAAANERQEIAGFSPVDLKLWLGIKLADALAYAHEKAILHLDIKPDNILLNLYGRPLLTDFNVSLRSMGGENHNVRGGTPRYMPPEQEALFRGEATILDERSDVYALGKVLSELFGATESTPPEMRAILQRCTAPAPAERFQSASSLGMALRGVREAHDLQNAVPPGAWTRAQGRHPYLLLGLVGTIPLGAILAITTFFTGRLHPPPEFVSGKEIFWQACRGLEVATLSWLVLIGALSRVRAGQWQRRLVLFLPLAFFLSEALLVWGIPAFFVYQPPPIPFEVVFAYARMSLSFTLLAVNAAFLWIQFLCGRIVYPRMWAGETEIRRRAKQETTLAMKTSLALQFTFVGLPLLVALAALFPNLMGGSLPLPLVVLGLIGAGVTGVGAFASVFLWTHLARIFR